NSDAKIPGIQAAYESMHTGMAAALSGADLLVGIGVLDDNNTMSLTQMIVEAEIARMVKRIREGVVVNDETLMVHLIEKAGPGQHFLGFKETLHGLKTGAVFFPKFSYRRTPRDPPAARPSAPGAVCASCRCSASSTASPPPGPPASRRSSPPPDPVSPFC